MKPSPCDVSVIICAYTEDRWFELEKAVQGVRNLSAPPGEIILVIDNNPRLLDRAYDEFERVIVISNSNTVGLSGARNSGVAASRGKITAFMDEDAIPEADWLERLVAPYEDPGVVGVGGWVQPMWLTQRPRWFPDEFDWVVGCSYRGLPTEAAPVRNFIGCNMSFRRELFDQVGGFNGGVGRIGSIPMGGEETEFCIRAMKHSSNHRLIFEPKARVYHRVPAYRTKFEYFVARCYGEGLSKAKVSRLVGARDGLSSEEAYIIKTLPRAIAREVTAGTLHLKRSAWLRAGVILAGFGMTTAGYLKGVVSPAARPKATAPHLQQGTELTSPLVAPPALERIPELVRNDQ